MEETKQIGSQGEEGTVSYGSDNVFADIGLSNPDERLVKAKLASTIHDIIRARGLTQKQAAEIMGIDQPKVSKIIRGRLNDFSTEWLLSRVLHMGLNVDIVIHTQTPSQKGEGAISIACI